MAECALRAYGRLPPKAGIYTVVVKATDYASALRGISTNDCLRVEVSQVTDSWENEEEDKD